MNTEKRTISAKDVSRILGTSQMVIKELVRDGKLPGIVISRDGRRERIIIPRAQFEAYLGEKVE